MKVKYECLSGYYIGDPGEYEIGDEIPEIGPVQNIAEWSDQKDDE